MKIKNIIFALTFCLLPVISSAQDEPNYYSFDTMPAYDLLPTISMRFVDSDKFTVIQWDLKSGAKLYPQHKHPNEQVTRILVGDVDAHSGDHVYHLHAGDVMMFPANVAHGFVAVTDAVIYEQQTPVREDFRQPGFIERLSELLRKNQ